MDILVADDSKTNLAIIANALHKLGHAVMTAMNGQEAIDLFQAHRPDLIILDVMMDGIDGFECARRIRTLESEEWIPIIFLSASVDDKSISQGIDAGGDDYLTKPFSEITLAAKIKAMQRISDMRNKLFEMTQKLYLLSSVDTLTGVYNRLQFDRSIKEIIAAADHFQHMLALLFIDVDNFKNINDSFGHHIGDLFLAEVASRLKSCVRPVDFVARLGGDEFAVILSQIQSADEAAEFAQNINNALAKNYYLEGHHLRNGVSIGIACYPTTTTNAAELVLNADIAMYHAKSLGRNNYKFFTQELNDKYKKQISLEHALKFALERNELFLTYQPMFDLRTKTLVGLEALLGWDHPKFGLVSPTIFLPIAEETGLIAYIGNWIFQTVCEESAHWPLNDFSQFKLAINVSSRQLLQENFFQQVVDTLSQATLPLNHFEFELAETAVMSDISNSFKETIKKFHDLGISIAIDDFGTGYSSLVRLNHLPINTLKIDKSFVQDVTNNQNAAVIVNCLIALGKNLNMNVIAEGIETKEQCDFLISKGCPQGQGYYLCKPLKTKQVLKFLNEMKLRDKSFTHS